MNHALDNMMTRRSVRAYTDRQVDDGLLNQVLLAGMYAPTGMGLQSPMIVVVKDKPTIALMARLNAQVLGNSDMDPFYGAPAVLVVLADKTVATYVQDGSLVMGNLMNAAHALGLGACWVHRAKETFQTPEGQALLAKWGIGGHYEGIANCIIGYPAGALPQAKPRKEDYVLRV